MVEPNQTGDISGEAELLSELKRIRKGRGLVDAARNGGIGPQLIRRCEIGAEDTEDQIVSKLTIRLSEAINHLGDGDGEAVSVALGIGPGFGTGELLGERISSFSTRLGVDDRTARRRIDSALASLADLVSRQPSRFSTLNNSARGWHARTVRAIVLLGSSGIEILEMRTVVSENPELRNIYLGFSAPRADANFEPPQNKLKIDALYGGDIVERRIETSARTGFSLEFPRPLKLGEVYEYGVRFRLPPEAKVLPYYVLVPVVTCDEFDLRVKFENIPTKVELLSGVFQADTQDSVLDAPAIEINILGEVHAKFKQLQPGMAYGIRWRAEQHAPTADSTHRA